MAKIGLVPAREFMLCSVEESMNCKLDYLGEILSVAGVLHIDWADRDCIVMAHLIAAMLIYAQSITAASMMVAVRRKFRPSSH